MADTEVLKEKEMTALNALTETKAPELHALTETDTTASHALTETDTTASHALTETEPAALNALTETEMTAEGAVVENKTGFPDHIKLLPRLITKPATAGPEFVRQHPVDAAVFVLLLHCLAVGFFILSLFHSLNGMLLGFMMDLGTNVNQGLSSLSAVIQDFAASLIKTVLSILPEIGQHLGDALSGAANAGIDHIAGLFSMQVTDLLSKLYQALRLPEQFGFFIGFLATLLQSLLLVLLLKAFLHFAKHPCGSIRGSLAAIAVRSMIAVPVILISSVIVLLNPLAGILVFCLLFIFELVYLHSALAGSVDEANKNRLGILFAFFAVLMLLISFAALSLVTAVTGFDVFARFTAMLYEIAG